MQALSDALEQELAKRDTNLPKFRPAEVAASTSSADKEDQLAALFRAGETLLRQRRQRLAQLQQSSTGSGCWNSTSSTRRKPRSCGPKSRCFRGKWGSNLDLS